MKKREKRNTRSLISSLAILLILSLLVGSLSFLATAQDTDDESAPGLEGLQGFQEISKKTKTQNWTYLTQEWKERIDHNPTLSKIFSVLNPFFIAFTGYEFALSGSFFIALIISLIFFFFAYEGIKNFYDNILVCSAIAGLITIIASSGGLTRIIVPKIEKLLNTWWKISIFVILGLMVIFLISYISKAIKKKRQERALEELASAESDLHKATRRLRGITQGMGRAQEGYEQAEKES